MSTNRKILVQIFPIKKFSTTKTKVPLRRVRLMHKKWINLHFLHYNNDNYKYINCPLSFYRIQAFWLGIFLGPAIISKYYSISLILHDDFSNLDLFLQDVRMMMVMTKKAGAWMVFPLLWCFLNTWLI